MASLTSLQLKELVANGGNLIINANEFPFLHIRELTVEAKKTGTTLLIRKVNALTSLQCKELAQLHPGYVTFDLTC